MIKPHPTEPHPSLASARFFGSITFLTVLLTMSIAFCTLIPPLVWWHPYDTAVTVHLSDLWSFIKQADIPRLATNKIGDLALYPLRLLAALIDATPPGDLVMPFALRFAVACAVGAATARPVFRRVRDASPKRISALHVNGPRPLWGPSGAGYLNATLQPLRRQTGDGIFLAPGTRLPLVTETEGVLLMGPPGSGKSVIAEGLMRQALTRRDRVLALDVKGQLSKRFARYKPLVFDLAGANSVVWAIGRDLLDDADSDEFAASLIPDSRDPVWAEGSRLILSAIVQHLQSERGQKWGWRDLHAMLSKPPGDLEYVIRTIAPEVAAMVMTRGEDPATFVLSLMFNLIAHVGSAARRFAKLEQNGAPSRSLRAWAVAGQWRRPIILRYDLQRRERSAAFVKLVLRVLAGTILGGDVEDEHDWHIWLFLDEVSRIGIDKCPAITDLAALGRSRGVRTVVTVQSPAQLKESEAFRENFGLQIICGLAPGESAQRVAKEWVAQRTIREADQPANADRQPREWTIPPITVSEYQSDLGLKFNLWGRPFIRAAVLGLADIPINDWPIHRWLPRKPQA
ncbi:type IV secretion system DNA-binding domain-containing protein [Bradyrhizobium septentrionale]|uniref:type IV secretion system DNA-binding domain-containing protein n=1 Tax=Bradyrhizobium septentrionale TaxID=1404411 RepID=UPI0015968D03|nr:type IV secretion system DNA-binding domain-containing protein [Bradyrhizobium septentrionale]UGY26669.1 type IV secretion system DNA-binding domain-containing protein [Bradyrhizobium septentrionale]